jgi:tetratricopeptide (TPR) repeat protein
MNPDLCVRRRSRRIDLRPAFLWVVTMLLLFAVVGVGFLIVRATMGEWLDLKLDSARYRVLELLPEPERPDYVPTPLIVNQNASAPTIVWQGNVVEHIASPTIAPTHGMIATSLPPTAVPGTAETPTRSPTFAPSPVPVVVGRVALNPTQPSVQLTGVVHEAQRFNNCGPTTLRMYLSFFGYTKDTQVQIANVLKPNKDDRNVSPEELTAYAQSKGFHTLIRVNGNLDRLKQILSNNLPVMIEEGYDPPRAHQGWMGHYLLLTGYDADGITAQDSYNGPNQRVGWQDVDDHWRNFNRTYLLIYTDAQEPVVRQILGDEMDDATMFALAAQRAQEEWNANPKDAFAAFNLGSSLVGLQEYDAAAQAFDQARVLKLPWRMLWYQFGPYEAYYHTGRYQELLALADATLKATGDLEESYYYKGLALQKLGRGEEARNMLQLALKYNSNYYAAQQALTELSQ